MRWFYYLWIFTTFCYLVNWIACLCSLGYNGNGVATSCVRRTHACAAAERRRGWLRCGWSCSRSARSAAGSTRCTPPTARCARPHARPAAAHPAQGSNIRYGWFFFVNMFQVRRCARPAADAKQIIFSGLMAAGVPYTGGGGFILAIATYNYGDTGASYVIFVSGACQPAPHMPSSAAQAACGASTLSAPCCWAARCWPCTAPTAAYVRASVGVRHGAQSLAKVKGEWQQEKSKGIYKLATSDVAVSAATAAAQQKWGENQSPV